MITFNPSADFSLFDGVEQVIYTHVGVNGQAGTVDTGVLALKHLTTVDIEASASELMVESGKWHILASTLTGKPKFDDRFTSATYGEWLVVDVESVTFGTRWAVTCQHI